MRAGYNLMHSLSRSWLLWLLLGWTPVRAEPEQETQSLEALQNAAETFLVDHYSPVDGRITVHANPLDPRLRLTPCQQPLQINLTGGRIGTSVANVTLHCTAPVEWRVHVIVQVRTFRFVLVTTRPMARGDAVTAADVRREERDATMMPYGFVTDLAQLEGVHLLRPVASGMVLAPGVLSPKYLVRSGEQVTLISLAGNIEVRAKVTALEDGAMGSRVRVKNPSSGRVIDTIVDSPGQVKVFP